MSAKSTIYTDEWGMWLIPYPMKTVETHPWLDRNQHPRDILQEHRHTWSRIDYLPSDITPDLGDFIQTEITTAALIEMSMMQQTRVRCERLKKEIEEWKTIFQQQR